jgi:hypothetical protein
MVMMTPDEVSCALSGGRERAQFSTVGDIGSSAGGSVETLYFFLTFVKILSPFPVAKSKSSHEDAGQDQGKFVSGGWRGRVP